MPYPNNPNRRPSIPDNIIASESIVTERKTYHVSLRQNRGGRLLRIDEERNNGAYAHHIMIPADNMDIIEAMIAAIRHVLPKA